MLVSRRFYSLKKKGYSKMHIIITHISLRKVEGKNLNIIIKEDVVLV